MKISGKGRPPIIAGAGPWYGWADAGIAEARVATHNETTAAR